MLKPSPLSVHDYQALFQQDKLGEQCLQVLSQAPVAISITDLKANIEYVNACFSSTTGYQASEVIGCNHSIISYKTTPLEQYQQLWETITQGKTWQGRLINRRKNGQRYLAEVSIAGLYDSDGKLSRFMGIHRDITQRHDMHTKVQNQKVMVEAVLNAAPVAVALLDEDFNVVLDNLSYKTLSSDLRCEPAAVVLDSVKGQLGEQALSQLLSPKFSEGHRVSFDMQQQQQARWFSCRFSRFELDEGMVEDYFSPVAKPHLILTLSEYTREYRRQQQQRFDELARTTAESEALHCMQEAMHAAIHQIQMPLNMIDAAVTMLCQGDSHCPKMAPLQAGLQAGGDAIKQLQQAIPERPYEAEQSLNLNQVIHEISAMSNTRLLERGIGLQLRLDGTLAAINGQPARLRVALKQVIDNAIEAIDLNRSAQREIILSSQCLDDAVLVEVEDSGPGIAKELSLKIFEPFYSTKPHGSGTCRGMGLSIVQQVMSEHKGTVQITPAAIGGCKVSLSLPLRGK